MRMSGSRCGSRGSPCRRRGVSSGSASSAGTPSEPQGASLSRRTARRSTPSVTPSAGTGTPGTHFWHFAPALQPERPATSPVINWSPGSSTTRGCRSAFPVLSRTPTLVSSERLTPFPTMAGYALARTSLRAGPPAPDDVPFRLASGRKGSSSPGQRRVLDPPPERHGPRSFLEISRSEATSVLVRWRLPPKTASSSMRSPPCRDDWGASWFQAASAPAASPSIDAQSAIARSDRPPDGLGSNPTSSGATE